MNHLIKPPSRLPNGKKNPEYMRWYRTTEAGKAAVKKWNSKPEAKVARKKYQATEKFKDIRKKSYREKFPVGSRKCIECGSIYDSTSVAMRGWRTFGNFNCICDLCS